ncbi:hypothetical protein BIY24_09515 [Halobacteriovorax marinus]|nr:hypothetical protein BIY24_09515 [Halobacteriovorax marinus]
MLKTPGERRKREIGRRLCSTCYLTPNNPDEGAGCDRERVLGFPGWKNDAENPRRVQDARDREEAL